MIYLKKRQIMDATRSDESTTKRVFVTVGTTLFDDLIRHVLQPDTLQVRIIMKRPKIRFIPVINIQKCVVPGVGEPRLHAPQTAGGPRLGARHSGSWNQHRHIVVPHQRDHPARLARILPSHFSRRSGELPGSSRSGQAARGGHQR